MRPSPLTDASSNVHFQTALPLASNATTLHRTFMDTVGRTTLVLTATNLVDDARDVPLVVTYEYAPAAILRKPLTIVVGLIGVFTTAWVIGRLDVSIGRKTTA